MANKPETTNARTINGVRFRVKEMVEVIEPDGDTWKARIVSFKDNSHQVIVEDIRRNKLQVWREFNNIRKIKDHGNTVRAKNRKHLPTY